MKKILFTVLAFLAVVGIANAATVVSGDTMWKIAQNANLSLQELIGMNPQISNPSLIYPGQEINIGGSLGVAAQRPSSYKTTLAESLSATASTTEEIKVSSLKTKELHTIVDADVGNFIILTISPGKGNEEKIMCTSGTDSVNNWEDCTRGYSYYSQAATGIVYPHSPGESVIISDDDAYISNKVAFIASANTFSGVNTFSSATANTFATSPLLTTHVTSTDENALQPKWYVDNLAIAAGSTWLPYGNSIYNTNSANVLIGTSTQAVGTYRNLHVYQSGGAYIAIDGASSNLEFVKGGVQQWSLSSGVTGLLQFFGGNSLMTLKANTGVGIGTNFSSPTSTLDVLGTFNVSGTTTLPYLGEIKPISQVTAGVGFAGKTSPVPTYIATSTGKALAADADETGTGFEFMGFITSDSAINTPATIQTGGVVSGFTGLHVGKDYFVSNTSTISSKVGTYPMKVGRAITSSSLLINKQKTLADAGDVIGMNADYFAQTDGYVNAYASYDGSGGMTFNGNTATSTTNYVTLASGQSSTVGTYTSINFFVKKGSYYRVNCTECTGQASYFTPYN